MGKSSSQDWLSIGMDAWLLGAEASMVMALRGARLAQGGSDAWVEAQRMVTEKAAANWSLGWALASGQVGNSPNAVARHTLRHYGKRVRANHRRLSKG